MNTRTNVRPDQAHTPVSRRWRNRILLASALLLALLLVIDIGLRVILGLGNPVLMQRDEAAGYVMAPSQHHWRFFCTNDINRYSMRSPEVSAVKPPGTVRMMFVGDSVTYGTTFVDQSRIFTSLVSRDLPLLTHHPVETLNASAGGWAVGNELRYLQSRGTFASDDVVFVLNTGDLVQPFNTMSVGTATDPRDPRPLCALTELWSRYLLPRLVHQEATHDAGSTANANATDVDRDTPPVLASLATARDLAKSNGARFAIIYCPCRGAEWETSEFVRGFSMLRQWAAVRDVPLIDLGRAFARHGAGEIYFDGVHLRPLGHAIAADEIEKAARGWISPPW